jgi:hypothetical protein
MLKKGKPKQDKKGQYLRKDSPFNIRDLVMRTPTSSSPSRSPQLQNEEKQTKPVKQDTPAKPSLAEILKIGNDKLADIIQELSSFDVSTIQRRSDPRIKALTGRINDIISEIFGRNSEEYDDYVIYSLDSLPITIGGSWYPLPEVQEGYHKGIQAAASKLTSLLTIQRRKLEAITTDKPKQHVVKESSVDQAITGKEKVSLVNLRGKIKSRETVFFNHVQPANGNVQTSYSHTNETDLTASTIKKIHQENNSNSLQAESKRITDCNIEKESVKGIPCEPKNFVLLENLEEKLKKLEEEITVLEIPQAEPVEIGQGTLLGGPDHEAASLSTLMVKLNDIVSSEPEYAEAYTKMVPDNVEKVLPLLENELSACGVIDGDAADESFAELAELESSRSENEEILIIDGDDLLSSESNFIESLENDDGMQETIESAAGKNYADNIAEGKKKVSLEDLEQKLREFEHKEAVEKEPPEYFKKTECEEVLLIEDTKGLSDEIMKELAQNTCPEEVCETRPGDEAVLVIGGDVNFNKHALLMNDDQQSDETDYSGASQKTLVDDEIMIIECDSGLPEDVSDELHPEEELSVNAETQSLTPETSVVALESCDDPAGQSDTGMSMLIDLFSRANPKDVFFVGSDEYEGKEILCEDLEERLEGFSSLEPEKEYVSLINLYQTEEAEAHPEEREANERADEHEISATMVLAIADVQDYLEKQCNIAGSLSAGYDQENQYTETVVEDESLELSEDVICDDNTMLEFECGFLPNDWDDTYYKVATDELMENVLFNAPNKEVIDQNIIQEKAFEECTDQILLKNIEALSENNYEVLISASDAMNGFEPMLKKTNDEKDFEIDSMELSQFNPDSLYDSENEGLGDLNTANREAIPEEAVFVVSGEELTNQAIEDLQEDKKKTLMESFEQATDDFEFSLDGEGLLTINERITLLDETTKYYPEDSVSFEVNEVKEQVSLQPDINDVPTEVILKSLDCQVTISQSVEDWVNNSLIIENNNEIQETFEIEEITTAERREFGFLETDEVFDPFAQDLQEHIATIELTDEFGPYGHSRNNSGEDELLSCGFFEKNLTGSEDTPSRENEVDKSLRDTILLEALEEMLNNLEINTPEQNHVSSEVITTQSTPTPKDEKSLVVESREESPKKAVLIKTTEERCNPFAMTEIEKEKLNTKTLRADELQTQIGELRYRIDDLKTFDVDSIEQRFDPRVRALGDTVNGTLADIFGRNTPSYWQHALPSLDSLPVVVGGPKLSPEELRDAYRRRINDAISKVNTTISILEAKMGTMKDKGSLKKQLEVITTQSTPTPKDEKSLVVESREESPKKAVLIKTTEERCNPFAMTEIEKEKLNTKTLRADELQTQIGELRYRIDDLKTFDVDSIEQRFDPRVRALGDTVNGTLADIFGRNTPSYWQHALPSLDSLPVVVGGPKLSPEELRDAYRRRINDAISKVNTTISILEAKMGTMKDKGSAGQVLFFTPKISKYPDIQSLR